MAASVFRKQYISTRRVLSYCLCGAAGGPFHFFCTLVGIPGPFTRGARGMGGDTPLNRGAWEPDRKSTSRYARFRVHMALVPAHAMALVLMLVLVLLLVPSQYPWEALQ